VLGVNGPVETFDGPRYKSIYQTFRDAQAAPASMPEVKGNVAAVLTENFWDHQLAAARDKKERTPEEGEIAKGAFNQGGTITVPPNSSTPRARLSPKLSPA